LGKVADRATRRATRVIDIFFYRTSRSVYTQRTREEMDFKRDAIRQYIDMLAIQQSAEKDRRRLQAGYKVFLSYSSVDHQVAEEISSLLTTLGISYFFDKKDISWGQQVVAGVSEGLKVCTHVLVVVSPASLKSSWVAFEIGQAHVLGKTVLPYLTHPSLDLPAFIEGLHYVTGLSAIREYFEKPAIAPEDVKELFDIVMSRLPDNLGEYSHSSERSDTEKEVWQYSKPTNEMPAASAEYGTVTIEGAGSAITVRTDFTLGRWRHQHSISYSEAAHEIEAFSPTPTPRWDGAVSNAPFSWPASPLFWDAIVKMLRDKLGKKSSRGESSH
jgi:hypothetical protein